MRRRASAQKCWLHTFTYNSHTSIKNCRIPSSFFPSCSSTNFISMHRSVTTAFPYMRIFFLLPGVTNADTVHSLNLSIVFKYLEFISFTALSFAAIEHTSNSASSSHPQSHPDSHSQSSGLHVDLVLRQHVPRHRLYAVSR